MNSTRLTGALIALVLMLAAAPVLAEPTTMPSDQPSAGQTGNVSPREIYLKTKPSLVVVKYTWAFELGSLEFTAAGIVVSKDGLVMFPIGIVPPAVVADDQMKDFKVVIPNDNADDTELDATLQGRDERTALAFVKVNDKRNWTPINFVNAPAEVGDTVYSVGILPKGAGYKAQVTTATIATKLRGPMPQILVDGALASIGAVVFNHSGDAIGYVHPRGFDEAKLDDPRHPEDISAIFSPPKLFVPASDFLATLQSPPVSDKAIILPWVGCELNGLEKQNAAYFNLKDTPAVQIGDVVKNSPADKAGLQTLDVIVKINGEPIERGDLPSELPQILTRKIQRMNVGDTITLSIIREKGSAPRDAKITLEAGPKEFHAAKRFFAKDMGLVVREVLFADTYHRKMNANTGGVVVALLKPQGPAMAAKLNYNDLITQMNGKPVTSLEQFKKDYQQYRKDSPHDPIVVEAIRPNGEDETIKIEPPQTDVVPGHSDDSQF